MTEDEKNLLTAVKIASKNLPPKVIMMLVSVECVFEDRMPSEHFHDGVTANNNKMISDTFKNGFREAA